MYTTSRILEAQEQVYCITTPDNRNDEILFLQYTLTSVLLATESPAGKFFLVNFHYLLYDLTATRSSMYAN